MRYGNKKLHKTDSPLREGEGGGDYPGRKNKISFFRFDIVAFGKFKSI